MRTVVAASLLSLGVILGACLDPRAELSRGQSSNGVLNPPSGSGSPGGDVVIGEVPAASIDAVGFSGVWMIDQPTHATYEASLYRFHSDGRLEFLETFDHGRVEPDYVTGTVSTADRSVICRFAESWSATDARTLRFGSLCTDGVAREVVLDLKTDSPGDWGYEPEIVSVGGESGWIHPDFPWRFLKCLPDRSNCKPL